MKKVKKDQTCIECGSHNVKMIYEGLETDTYKCLNCKKKFGISDWRRIAGYTKREVEEMDKRK